MCCANTPTKQFSNTLAAPPGPSLSLSKPQVYAMAGMLGLVCVCLVVAVVVIIYVWCKRNERHKVCGVTVCERDGSSKGRLPMQWNNVNIWKRSLAHNLWIDDTPTTKPLQSLSINGVLCWHGLRNAIALLYIHIIIAFVIMWCGLYCLDCQFGQPPDIWRWSPGDHKYDQRQWIGSKVTWATNHRTANQEDRNCWYVVQTQTTHIA